MPTKKEHMKKVIEDHNLDAPADSVEFLQYAQKHQEKVQHHKRRLHGISKVLMVVGCCALGYMAFRHFTHKKRMHDHHSNNQHGHFKLGASNEAAVEETNMSPIFNALSVAVWGLVVGKAKTGLEAATKNDSSTVGGLVKKVGAICALIAGASILQLMSTMNTANPVEAVKKASAPKLQASHHPESYYDKESSHYMGGAHNVLLEYSKSYMNGTPTKTQQQNLGDHGHNVLLNVASDFQQGKSSVPS
jgi:uncharacterized membrane protein YidH (DUF202 family)